MISVSASTPTTLQPGRQALLCWLVGFLAGLSVTYLEVQLTAFCPLLLFCSNFPLCPAPAVLCVSRLGLPFSFSLFPSCFLFPLLWFWPWRLTIVQQSLNVKNINPLKYVQLAEPYAWFKEREKHSKLCTLSVVYHRVTRPVLKRMKFRHRTELLFGFM